MQRYGWIVGMATLLETAMMVGANSFTFDFRYPNGIGSSYADAISLNTVGALRDKNGKPIGFTRANLGADVSGWVACMVLTPQGLEFDTTQGNAMLGVPFNTTGPGQDPNEGAGDIRIFAALQNVQGMDKSWEQIAVGWGFGNTTGAHTNFSGARIMAEPGIVYQGFSAPTLKSETGSIPDQNITVRKWQNGPPLRFYANFDTGGNSIIDNYGLINTASGVFGLFGLNKTSGGDGFSGRLVAIRFFGVNLVVPEIQPPRGSVLIFK